MSVICLITTLILSCVNVRNVYCNPYENWKVSDGITTSVGLRLEDTQLKNQYEVVDLVIREQCKGIKIQQTEHGFKI